VVVVMLAGGPTGHAAAAAPAPDASVVLPPASPPDRPCAFIGIRRGQPLACVGMERTVLGRPFCVHAPADRRPKLPVVLLLHGYSSSGGAQARYFDLDSHVDRRGFILVKPDGTMNSQGSRFWNAGRRLSSSGPDDIGYLGAVIQDVLTVFDADPRRVFVVGHSNGAFMAHHLACQRSESVAAIVTLAGGVDPGACRPARPVSVLTVHGTEDPLIKYGGGSVSVFGGYSSVDATLDFWARADGCQATRTTGKPLQLVCAPVHAETVVTSFAGCPAGIAVEHWRLEGVGHVPDFALPAWPDALLDFLWAHPRPVPAR
jgi:polyhydroxybutyrate depolymerase